MRGVIFDLDGTLVDSIPGIAAALNEALTRHGFETHSEQTVSTFVGDGIRTTCQRAVPEGTADEIIDRLAQAHGELYGQLWRAHTEPFEGITELLDELLGAGIAIGVCSNKSDQFTGEMVSALFPQIPSPLIVGHRAGTALKPDPASALAVARAMDLPAADIAFVGDSTVDFETASNAGMAPILVAWGYHDEAALAGTGAPLIDSVSALRPALGAPGAA